MGQEITNLIVTPDQVAKLLAGLHEARDGKPLQNLVFLGRRKNGDLFDAFINISPIIDKRNGVSGFSLTLRDISEIKSAQRQLEELNLTLEHQVQLRTKQLASVSSQLIIAAEVAKLGIWHYNVNSDRLEWNQRMFEIYQQPESLKFDGVKYRHWQERLHLEDLEKAEAALQNAIAGVGDFDEIFRIVLPDSSVRFIHGIARVERDSNGKAMRVIGVNIDITSQALLESELRQAKELSDAASEAKSQFLANMSHEIRTPMNAVLGMLSLIKQTTLDRQQLDYVNKVNTAARSLLNILDEILDYSKISAGKLVLDPIAFNLEDMLRELSVVLAGNHGDKPVEVILDVDPKLPAQIIADKSRLQQVLINLAGNALKFTEKGHVVVRFLCLAQSSTHLQLGIEVEDTGIGIAPEQQQRIFEGFIQAEASISRRFGGTGLGLVISKRLLDLMGADLKLQSTPGVGTLFSFALELPLVSIAPGQPGHIVAQLPASSKDKNQHILIVDDNDFMIEVLEGGLRNAGWNVHSANSAEAAFAAIAAAEKAQREFDVILMDWNMPGMNGLEASAVIRNNTSYADKPLIIMLTAYERELLAQSTKLGDKPFDELLVKPVTITQIEETIQYLCTDEPISTSIDNQIPSLSGFSILVVEDNELNRQVASELLSLAGARVLLAENGFEGVEAVLSPANRFDIVLMDLQMPEMDGLEATKRIRADGRFDTLPILAMTANASPRDREMCLAAGMNEHIGKPFDMNKLAPLIRHLCHAEPNASPSETQLQANLHTQQRIAAENPDEDLGSIDLANIPLSENSPQILARFGNMPELALRMRDRFEIEANRLFEKISSALEEENLPGLSLALHSLKGVAATLGALRLTKLCSIYEEQSRREEVLSKNDLAALSSLINESIAVIKALSFSLQPKQTPTQLNQSEILSLMEQLEKLLENDDLAAVDLSQRIGGLASTGVLGQKLNLQVSDLHYGAALATLKELKEVFSHQHHLH